MPDSMSQAETAWREIRENPNVEQQFRVRTPLAAGGTIVAEINMIGIVEDGEFTGAHGSLRDVTERGRLEEDLRRRSAELAANEERASLARELHDSVTQALFSMGLTLQHNRAAARPRPGRRPRQVRRGARAAERRPGRDACADLRVAPARP